MARVLFERRYESACFHNPLKNGELDAQQIEIRLDPLIGHQSIFNSAIEGKSALLFPDTDVEYLKQRSEATKQKCFLCEGRWREMTPRYGSSILPEGRLIRGGVVLFPNLFPLSAVHAVVMLGERHHRSLDDFPPELLYDAFAVSVEFIRRCADADPETAFFTINANYLFPAGASVVHPHFQVLGSRYPGTHHRLLLDRSFDYLSANGSCYWSDLIAAEKKAGERLIGSLDGCEWLTAFSPLGSNEVNGVWPDSRHFLEWTDTELRGASEGMSRVLRAYHGMKLSTFNMSCFSGPINRSGPEFRCMLRLVNRQNVAPHYRADDYYFQKLLKNEIIVRRPEELASFIRGYFKAFL
ncbi:MAG: hypothetical protein LLF99_10415 [Desulfobacteraceae bacterium]|nr:hypothetical protein [Desulfobacteraceae bacterium]